MTLLAKSPANGGTTLFDHTVYVVTAIQKIAPHVCADLAEADSATILHGAVLHDLGKAHPCFQDSLKPGFIRKPQEYHRHEISSILFLPLFPRDEWPMLVDMVIAHHKSVSLDEGDATKHGRGLIDLVDGHGEDVVFAKHAEDWDEWHPKVFFILKHFRIPAREIPLDEAREAFDFAVAHCEQVGFGRNRWRGLLMSADHFASAMEDGTSQRLSRMFLPPDLSTFDHRAKTVAGDLYPLAKINADDPRSHTIVIAPTGAGKTDYLLRRTRRRVFYLLPFQASINAMFLRLDELLNGEEQNRKPDEDITDIRRVHAASKIEIDSGIKEEHILQRHVGAAIKVMTPHQAASIVFGISGHEAMALDLAGQDVIMDEVHVYGEYARAMVLEMVTALARLGCRLHIGSATIPSALMEELRSRLGGPDKVLEVRLSNEALKTYDRHIVIKVADEAEARRQVIEALKRKERVLFIANRVALAQERYRWAKQEFADASIPLLLVHSRYRRRDRAKHEVLIDKFDKQNGPCLVCTTQVVEVSLDISFDTLVTDAAPLDSLIQRFGRVNRRRDPTAGTRNVYVIAPPDSTQDARPYNLQNIQQSFAILPDGSVLAESQLQQLIDFVYPDVEVLPIDTHLFETNGQPNLRELCHRQRSVLLDALEIDSACCVRDSDAEDYQFGNPEQRLGLEIPVPWKVVQHRARQWRRLENIGHSPLVVPDSCYSEEFGLEFIEPQGDGPCIPQSLGNIWFRW